MSGRIRTAQLVAEAVAVLCPICAETQPAPGGSEFWTAEDFIKGAGRRECSGCGAAINIQPLTTVRFS